MESKLSCSIPVQATAFNSSLHKDIENDFYTYANKKWLKSTSIPAFETDFGVSEEVERCIVKKTVDILTKIWKDKESKDPTHVFLRTLAESCLHSGSQHTSVDFLKEIIKSLSAVYTIDDVFQHYSELSALRFQGLLQIGYTIDLDGRVQLCIDGNLPSLPLSWYFKQDKMKEYKELLQTLGKEFDIKHLEECIATEKDIVLKLEDTYREDVTKTTGYGLIKKYPGIPWDIFFRAHGLENWKKMVFYYRSPQWLRGLSKLLKVIPIEIWKLLLARAYIFGSLRYLPPPYDEYDSNFFHFGQRVKMPQMELFVSIVYDYCNDLFSPIFWKECGDDKIVPEIEEFTESLIKGAMKRLETVEWLNKNTRKKAIEKIEHMNLELVRPKKWGEYKLFDLDPKNLLKNIYLLGAKVNEIMISRQGDKYTFWEEGIYRVNAYYFNENNEIMIPYGTIVSPFYIRQEDMKEDKKDKIKRIAWNYGALGSIIGHEMCHAFDEDGKNYNSKGKKKNWWYHSDKIAYRMKTRALIELYNKQIILGKHLNGEKTLSENIADLGGIGISLHGLKEYLDKEGVKDGDRNEYYREFFIAFATSWRTKYKKKKLEMSLDIDRHAPANFRVNLIVAQFKEWYEAFDLKMPGDYIRIF